MTVITIPDVSEYQSVDFDVFAGPIIVRAHNGTRVDHHWIPHAAGAARQPWWAAYQYLPANVDAGTAAHRFLDVLSFAPVKPNATILDLEEGAGDQSGRQHAWLEVMAGDDADDWTYSGLYFARTHGLTVEWIAAYGQREPTDAHTLWQYTDAQDFAGIGRCDASIFHGDLAELVALTNPGAPPMFTPEQEATIYNAAFRIMEAPHPNDIIGALNQRIDALAAVVVANLNAAPNPAADIADIAKAVRDEFHTRPLT